MKWIELSNQESIQESWRKKTELGYRLLRYSKFWITDFLHWKSHCQLQILKNIPFCSWKRFLIPIEQTCKKVDYSYAFCRINQIVLDDWEKQTLFRPGQLISWSEPCKEFSKNNQIIRWVRNFSLTKNPYSERFNKDKIKLELSCLFFFSFLFFFNLCRIKQRMPVISVNILRVIPEVIRKHSSFFISITTFQLCIQ